jgi:RNA polymerase subunit RPABC4/transcription elongation factor Spt4
MAKSSPPSQRVDVSTKKCPECYGYVPVKAEVCPLCKTRLGKVGKHGMAERTTNWKAYILCIIAWLIFFIYIKIAFF